jgi:hypothetical protein
VIQSQRINKELVQHEVGDPAFSQHYDVIVVGLGTAGSIAAIAAARQGCKVLGLETLNCMGGTGTAGAILSYYFGIRGGMHEELDEEAKQMEDEGYPKRGKISGDLKKIMLERNALESGVTIGYEATVIGVYLEGKTVKGVRWISPEGIQEAGSTIVIDCTGNADVCIMAGCEFRFGRELDGQGQPYSNVFEQVEGRLVAAFYTDSGYVDPTDGEDVSRAIIESATLTTHLKESYSDNPRMLRMAPMLGIREGRFIEGEEQVTLTAFLHDHTSSEPVLYAYSNLDNHSKDIAFESTEQQDWIVGASLWGLNFSVPIPLGALIPKGFDGLMTAGRCMAIDHDISGCVRMKREMQKSGEAAATAAAIAIKSGIPVRDVPYESLFPVLSATGCLNEQLFVRFKDTSLPRETWMITERNPSYIWLTDKAAIRAGLSGEKPGIAIWSAKRLGSEIHEELRQWLEQTEDVHLRRNSAFALALLGDSAPIPILREMVMERDPFMPKTSRKYNQVRGYAAIYLLGRLGDEAIIPELIAIMKDRASFKNASTDAEFINTDDEFFFQYFSFSLMALFRIGERHPHTRPHIVETVNEIVSSELFTLSVTLKGNTVLEHDMTASVRSIIARKLAEWADQKVMQ